MHNGWKVERYAATAGEIHALGIPEFVERTVRVFDVTRSAIVLGSTQDLHDVDADVARALKVDVLRRRSGGGAVLVEPHDIVWFDVLIPRDDVLWTNDVGRAFHWLGQVIRAALSDMSVRNVEVYQGALITTNWSKKICFAGLGPGECTIDEKKILGISQRRTRQGALFQASINKRFDAQKIARLLSVPSEVMVEAVSPLVGALPALDAEAFVTALVHRLDQV